MQAGPSVWNKEMCGDGVGIADNKVGDQIDRRDPIWPCSTIHNRSDLRLTFAEALIGQAHFRRVTGASV